MRYYYAAVGSGRLTQALGRKENGEPYTIFGNPDCLAWGQHHRPCGWRCGSRVTLGQHRKVFRGRWRRKIGPARRDRMSTVALETWVNQKVACESRVGSHNQGCRQDQKNEVYALFHRRMGVLASPGHLQRGKLNPLLPARTGCQYKQIIGPSAGTPPSI